MSPKKTISAKNNTVNLGLKKRIDITIYKGLIFLHINDMFNQKSISLTEKEYLTLNKETKKIQKKIANAKALLKEQNKKMPRLRFSFGLFCKNFLKNFPS